MTRPLRQLALPQSSRAGDTFPCRSKAVSVPHLTSSITAISFHSKTKIRFTISPPGSQTCVTSFAQTGYSKGQCPGRAATPFALLAHRFFALPTNTEQRNVGTHCFSKTRYESDLLPEFFHLVFGDVGKMPWSIVSWSLAGRLPRQQVIF